MDGAIFERDVENELVKEVMEKILFEVFVHEFKQQYVGEDTQELRSFILTSTTKAITSIRASFIHTRTGRKITISPDDIFKEMSEYVVLLPDDATDWIFSLRGGSCLPWLPTTSRLW